MKRFFLSIAIVILSFSTFANTLTNSSIIEYEDGNILIEIELGDITDMSKADLYDKMDASFTKQMPTIDSVAPNEELTCTVKVTGSVGVGSNKIAIEVSVSGPCSKVRAEAKKLLAEIKEEVKALI